MKDNDLYFFALQFFKPPHPRLQLVFKKNFFGNDYVFHEFPVTTPYQLPLLIHGKKQELQLTSNHISFYKEQDPTNPMLSEYHYTAYFVDEEDNHYKVHVYFNHEDQLTIEPQLLIRQPDYSYRHQTMPGHDLAPLKQRALELCLPFINNFRKLSSTQLQNDFTKYNSHIKRLTELTIHLNKNILLYQEELSKLINLLQQVLAYYHEKKPYTYLLTLSQQLKAHLDTADSPEMPSDQLPHIQEATKSYNEFIRLKKNKAPWVELTQALSNSYKEAFCLLTSTSKAKQQHPLSDLVAVHKLTIQNTQERQQLLEQLVLHKQFELAQQLVTSHSPQHNVLPYESVKKLIAQSITENNSSLLAFLLNHHDIDFSQIEINEQSLAAYCLKQHAWKTPYVACLGILIKHGASLFELEPETQIPIAQNILNDPNHPLKQALILNSQRTLLNDSFYLALVNDLERRLAKSIEPNEALKSQIVFYTFILKQLPRDRSLKIYERIHSEINLLFFNNKIQIKTKAVTSLAESTLKRLPLKEQLLIQRLKKDAFALFNELITLEPNLALTQLRTAALQKLDELLRQAHLFEKLDRVQREQAELSKNGAKSTRLIRKEKQIDEQLKAQGSSDTPAPNTPTTQKKLKFFNGAARAIKQEEESSLRMLTR
jgi:hypothetical protein